MASQSTGDNNLLDVSSSAGKLRVTRRKSFGPEGQAKIEISGDLETSIPPRSRK